MNLKFTIIGAGNLATHLSAALKMNGFHIVQVYSRTESSAMQLAKKLNTSFTTSYQNITTDADVYVVAIKDSVYSEVLSHIEFGNKLLVHCSGSQSLSVIESYSENTGVLYPLQTFSKQRNVNFSEIPVFIEANSEKNEKTVLEVARKLSSSVSVLKSPQRIYLHIAAVFACNFVNHFYSIAADVLESENIPFDVLKPLVLETARKVQVMKPGEAQTGPAIRYDENVIGTHLKKLKGIKNYAELYNSISKSIFEAHQKNK